jgi:hypothetical protein
LSRAELFAKFNKNANNEKDRQAVYRKLSDIFSKYGYVTKQKDTINQNSLVSITLTERGKDVLRSPKTVSVIKQEASTPSKKPAKQVSLQSIADDIGEFNRQNPSWTLEIPQPKFKEERHEP